MIGITQPHPMAEAIPTRIKKMSRGEANAKTLGGEKMEGKFKNKINKKKVEDPIWIPLMTLS